MMMYSRWRVWKPWLFVWSELPGKTMMLPLGTIIICPGWPFWPGIWMICCWLKLFAGMINCFCCPGENIYSSSFINWKIWKLLQKNFINVKNKRWIFWKNKTRKRQKLPFETWGDWSIRFFGWEAELGVSITSGCCCWCVTSTYVMPPKLQVFKFSILFELYLVQ